MNPLAYLLAFQSGNPPRNPNDWEDVRFRWKREDEYVMNIEPRWLGRDLYKYLKSINELPAADIEGGENGPLARQRRLRWFQKNNDAKFWTKRKPRPSALKARKLALERKLNELENKGVDVSEALAPADSAEGLRRDGSYVYAQRRQLHPLRLKRDGTKLLRVLFLEDDGVLNHLPDGKEEVSPWALEEEFVNRLIHVLDSADAYLVVCSIRRKVPPLLAELLHMLFSHGLPFFRYLGTTCSLPNDGPHLRRRIDECEAWVKDQETANVEVESWIIIDKVIGYWSDRTREFRKEHFLQTHQRKGLTEERMEAAIQLLLLPTNRRKNLLEQDLMERKSSFESAAKSVWEIFRNRWPIHSGSASR